MRSLYNMRTIIGLHNSQAQPKQSRSIEGLQYNLHKLYQINVADYYNLLHNCFQI